MFILQIYMKPLYWSHVQHMWNEQEDKDRWGGARWQEGVIAWWCNCCRCVYVSRRLQWGKCGQCQCHVIKDDRLCCQRLQLHVQTLHRDISLPFHCPPLPVLQLHAHIRWLLFSAFTFWEMLSIRLHAVIKTEQRLLLKQIKLIVCVCFCLTFYRAVKICTPGRKEEAPMTPRRTPARFGL